MSVKNDEIAKETYHAIGGCFASTTAHTASAINTRGRVAMHARFIDQHHTCTVAAIAALIFATTACGQVLDEAEELDEIATAIELEYGGLEMTDELPMFADEAGFTTIALSRSISGGLVYRTASECDGAMSRIETGGVPRWDGQVPASSSSYSESFR